MGKLMYTLIVKKRTGLLLIFSLCVGILVGDRASASRYEDKGISQQTTLEINDVDLTAIVLTGESFALREKTADVNLPFNSFPNFTIRGNFIKSEKTLGGK